MASIDARVEIEKLRKLYEADPRQQSFNLLLLGEKGTGKTRLLSTARKPVHIDSFDPGGTLTLRDHIKKGSIIADTRWEQEDPYKPTQFKQWEFEFTKRIQSGYFTQFGTYCLDSATTWADCIMNWVLATVDKNRQGGITSHAGEVPKWNRDYKPQRNEIEKHIRLMLNLPCDFILTGHLMGRYEPKLVVQPDGTAEKEDILVDYVFHTTGQGTITIPRYFTEMWLTMYKEAPKVEDSYFLLTRTEGLYKASTRLGGEGRFEKREKPDIKALLRKAGLPWEDKVFSEEEKESA